MKNLAAALRAAGIAAALAFTALITTPATAATTDFSDVKALIKKHDLDAAEKRVDAILKAEPENVNALMYKGNIIFYRNTNTAGIQLYTNQDESIFHSDIGSLGAGSSLMSREAAQKVAIYFKRALARAPQRMDIQFGLCWTYANAGMKDELIARFPALRKYAGNHQGLQYNMGDYARVIADNYSFEDGMAVYREIARLYPDDGNISNDMAAMYLKHRDLDTAMRYFDEAVHRKHHDADTWQNLALLYTVTGQYRKGLAAQKKLSSLHHDRNWLLYDALYARLRKDAHWQKKVDGYIRKHGGSKHSQTYVAFARAILPVKGAYPPAQLAQANGMKVATQFVILNNAALAQEFPSRFDAAIRFADLLSYYYNYRHALEVLDGIDQRKLAKRPEHVEQVRFYQAWSLYASGQKEAAAAKWKELLDSKDFYRKSAAAYFLGNHAFEQQHFREAADYCKRVKDDASKSKYAMYCANLYDRADEKL